MNRKKLFPDYILESSWEVCNKVGGIYTVLSTRARTLQAVMPDRIIFVGPLLNGENTGFQEVNSLYADWVKQARTDGLNVKVGRWDVPGSPVAAVRRIWRCCSRSRLAPPCWCMANVLNYSYRY